jgi:hypothetical protein
MTETIVIDRCVQVSREYARGKCASVVNVSASGEILAQLSTKVGD